MKLSICMMVKNEEKYLEQCLISLKWLTEGVEAELIIVDTGSTDNTVEIAKRYTDKVYFHTWNNDFADMRNTTIRYAKGEWILIIDGDEALENIEDLVDFITSDNINEYGAAFLLLKNFMGQGEDYSLSKVMRLFRNKSFKYVGTIHEKPLYSGEVKQLKTQIVHYGYLQKDSKNMEEKYNRNYRILMSEIEKNPDNIMLRHYLSTTCRLYGDTDEALKQSWMAYDSGKKTGEVYPFIYTQLVMCLIDKNEYDKAEEVCLQGVGEYPKHIDLYYCLSKLLGISKKYDLAVKYYKKFIELTNIAEEIILESDGETGFLFLDRVEEAHIDLAIIYFENNDYELAMQYASQVKDDKYFKRAAGIIKDIYKIYLSKNDISDKDYIYLFEKYLQTGLEYINRIYSDITISNEETKKIECKEDLFFVYMQKGLQQKDRGNLLNYIKKAVNVYPDMNKGIILLLKNL